MTDRAFARAVDRAIVDVGRAAAAEEDREILARERAVPDRTSIDVSYTVRFTYIARRAWWASGDPPPKRRGA